jgi:hypothetical protein
MRWICASPRAGARRGRTISTEHGASRATLSDVLPMTRSKTRL